MKSLKMLEIQYGELKNKQRYHKKQILQSKLWLKREQDVKTIKELEQNIEDLKEKLSPIENEIFEFYDCLDRLEDLQRQEETINV